MGTMDKPAWAVGQLHRETGLVEDICPHGIGHPNATWLERHAPGDKLGLGVHGCDGCCSRCHRCGAAPETHICEEVDDATQES